MDLKEGDFITCDSIATGKYLGDCEVYDGKYHRVFDTHNKVTLFIPFGEEEQFRKIPTKQTVQKCLNIFRKNELIDAKQIDGSRYKYFKEKLKNASFKKSVEVLHDLYVLKQNKKTSHSERKLFTTLKDNLLNEISFALSETTENIENRLFAK